MGYISVVPNILIGVVYWLTCRALKSNTAKHANNEAMLKRFKANAKIVKMFIIIISVFFVLTMPYALFYFAANHIVSYDTSLNASDYNLLATLNYILFIPSAANGCVNPIIYARRQKEINAFVKGLARRLLRCVPLTACHFGRHSLYEVSSAWSVTSQKTSQLPM